MTEEFISKSQRKRDAHRLQKLGETLVSLPQTELDALPLTDTLSMAIQEARRLTKHGARRRQLQYIGKLMRQIDCEPLFNAMAQRNAESARDNAAFHILEYWRDHLVQHGDAALNELLGVNVAINRQQIRQWIRTAQREQEANKPPKAARALFRYLREVNATTPLPAPPTESKA
jgi:ribosome-associated protein